MLSCGKRFDKFLDTLFIRYNLIIDLRDFYFISFFVLGNFSLGLCYQLYHRFAVLVQLFNFSNHFFVQHIAVRIFHVAPMTAAALLRRAEIVINRLSSGS